VEWTDLHPALGALALAMFIFQGVTGIGSVDAAGDDWQRPGPARRHRRNGMVLAALLPAVYAAGMLTVLARGYHIAAHPTHLVNGTLLLTATTAAFLLARRFRKTRSRRARNIHMTLGAIAITLMLAQGVIGLGMLLGVRAT